MAPPAARRSGSELDQVDAGDPDEAGRAYEALGARYLLAMHWGTFKLTDEPTGEPRERALQLWAERGLAPERLWILDVGESRALR